MALDILSCIQSFIIISECSSFSKAAHKLHVSPPVLTKQMQKLEEHLGKILMTRSTRTVNLTEAGILYLSKAKQILQDLADAKNSIYNIEQEPHGIIRIGLPGIFAKSPFSNIFQRFLAEYPKLVLNVTNEIFISNLSNSQLDILISELDIKEPQFHKTYLGKVHRSIFASPDYLKQHGIPQTIDDLQQHNCLIYTNVSPTNEWILDNKRVKVHGNYASNSASSIIAMALSGLGLTWGVTQLYKEELDSGRLVEVPIKYTSTTRNIYIYTLSIDNANIRLLINYLKQEISLIL